MSYPARYDVEIALVNQPGTLASMGEALGKEGIPIHGGGVFTINDNAVAHFLFEDGEAASICLTKAGISVTAVRPALLQRLRQGIPGQLGHFARLLADAGVNILVQYSDHDNRLVIVTDKVVAAQKVSDEWEHNNVPTEAP